MLFALHNFIQYRLRRGPYGSQQRDAAMGNAFVDSIPREIIENVPPGTLVFTQRLNSWKSWAMMYFTSSQIDHAGIIGPDGRLMHMTFQGFRQHHLVTFAVGTRILFFDPDVVGVRDPMEAPGRLHQAGMRLAKWPAEVQLAWAAALINLGRFPDRFKIKFLIDIAILTALIDGISWALGGPAFAFYGAAFALAATIFNLVSAAIDRKRGLPPRIISHPDLGYRACFRLGGILVTKLGPLVVSGLGIMPTHIFSAIESHFRLAEKYPPDEAANRSSLSQYWVDSVELQAFLDSGGGVGLKRRASNPDATVYGAPEAG